MSPRWPFFVVMAIVCLTGSAPADPPAGAADESIRRYVALLKDRDPLVRKRAALVLRRMGAKAKGAVPALEEALADEDADVRSAAAGALEAIDPPPPSGARSGKAPAPDPSGFRNRPLTARDRASPPSREREETGNFHLDAKSLPSILVVRKDEEDGWRRLKMGARVSTRDELVSLPGYVSEIRLDGGVRLLLRGHVREFSLDPMMDYLQESAVVLHKSTDADCDVTLRRGRLFFSNHKDKGPALVRLRFEKQVWDVTLNEPGSEVVVDLFKRYRADIDYRHGEDPLATLYLLALSGDTDLTVGLDRYLLSGPPRQAFVAWSNRDGAIQPQRMKQEMARFFQVVLPADPKNVLAEPMGRALEALGRRMVGDKPPAVALAEVLQQSEDRAQRQLAVYCLGALDEVNKLLRVLGDPDPGHAADRDTAVFTLRRWLGRDARQGPKLYDEKTGTGLLKADKEFTGAQAEAIFRLLHDYTEDDRHKPETYEFLATCLLSDKVALAELARWHLYRLARRFGVALPKLERFNAAVPKDAPERVAAAREVMDKVNKGELPPSSFRSPGPKRSAP